MFIVDLVCGAAHLFEGWYDSKEAFDDARRAAALTCPVCGDVDVEQRPSFRGIVSRSSSSRPKRAAPPPQHNPATARALPPTATAAAPAPPLPLEVQRALSRLIKIVKSQTQDAGDAFAVRALAMHKGDEEPAAIHGTSTLEERQTLMNEGVPFGVIPVPDIDQN